LSPSAALARVLPFADPLAVAAAEPDGLAPPAPVREAVRDAPAAVADPPEAVPVALPAPAEEPLQPARPSTSSAAIDPTRTLGLTRTLDLTRR
jgi:hypothetical protein